MGTLRCKMCGGNLNLISGSSVAECEYCGSQQTVPLIGKDDIKKQRLYARANKLRYNADFDRAYDAYENIVEEYPEDAEGYWGLVLCKYGIEYVDDQTTNRKVATCHRSSFISIFDDPDFEWYRVPLRKYFKKFKSHNTHISPRKNAKLLKI